MLQQRQCDLVVLGGGLAGLTFALEAARRGRQVIVLESGPEVGGLARTLVFGDYRFDIGGHRFHSTWPHVTEWLRSLMGSDLLQVPRQSRIRLNGRYVDYPLRFPNALTAFPLAQAAHVLASYLGASVQQYVDGHQPDRSFEDWVARRFGRALYDVYFRPYTEKVWGIPCRELSADWASERIQLPSLAAAVKGSLFPRRDGHATLISRFLYPRHGIGMIPHRLAKKATASGRAAIEVDSEVFRLESDGPAAPWRVHYRREGREEVVSGRQVISTVSLRTLWRALPAGDAGRPGLDGTLAYRGLVCIFLAIGRSNVSEDTWTYFPDSNVGFGRTHEPSNWSPEMAPPGQTSLCVEVFCTQGDSVWRRDDGELVDWVVDDLDRLGVLARESVRDAWVYRTPEAYPCYRVGYRTALRRATDYLSHRYPTLHLLGRTGTFQYMNMDAVIHQALQALDSLGCGA